MTMDLGTLAILFPMLFLLLGLGFTVVIDPYIQQKQRRIMLLIVVLCLSLIVQNLWENELFVSHSHLALKNLLSAYGYSVRPVFLVLFLYITCHPDWGKQSHVNPPLIQFFQYQHCNPGIISRCNS